MEGQHGRGVGAQVGGHAHHGLQAAGAGGQDGAARVQPGRAADEPGPQGTGHDEQGRGAEHQGGHGADLQQGAAGHHIADHDADGDLGPQLEQMGRIGLHMSQHLDGQHGHYGPQHGTAGDMQEEEQQAAHDAAGDEEQEGRHGSSMGCKRGDHDAATGSRRSRLRRQRFFGVAGSGMTLPWGKGEGWNGGAGGDGAWAEEGGHRSPPDKAGKRGRKALVQGAPFPAVIFSTTTARGGRAVRYHRQRPR